MKVATFLDETSTRVLLDEGCRIESIYQHDEVNKTCVIASA
jgi:hypothetical protein